MAKRGIPMHSMGKIIASETELRVSSDAKLAMKMHLEEFTEKIAKKAILYAKHAKRKTVLKEDVDLAIEEISRQ